MRKFFVAPSLAAALLLCATRPTVAQLSASEQTIAAAVDRHNAQALELLEQLVNINSGTMNFTGVRAVADVLRPRLEALGFTTRWVDGAAFHRAGHLVAEHPGPGPKLLLVGHLDTVFEPDNPFQKFERLDDSTARGPGVIDMKGGDVVALYALQALSDAGLLARMHVVFVLDGDEEEVGSPVRAARAALVEAATGAAAGMGFEDGAGDPRSAVISRRGDVDWTLTTTGVPGHSGQIFGSEIGAGAVFEASRILHQFYTTLAAQRYLTFSPGLALGGTAATLDSTETAGSARGKQNVVAQRMEVTGDLRTVSPAQLDAAKASMRRIVAAHLPKTDASIAFDDHYPPMAPTAGTHRLLAIYDRASQDLGLGTVVAVDPSKAGAADVAFVAARVPMLIDGIGLSGRDDHSAMETANLNRLPSQTKRAAITMWRLTEGGVRP